MEVTQKKNDQVAGMKFSSVYPHYVTKVEKKGRMVEELHEVIHWLTGFDSEKLNQLVEQQVTFHEFFDQASLNSNAHLITGVICGYRIEDIPDQFDTYRNVRYLDKLVDELARGRKLEKIMRAS